MCRDCPTRRNQVRALSHELGAAALLPFHLFGSLILLLLLTGYLGT